MRVLVTGAAGLYGVHIVDSLVNNSNVSAVIGIDNFSRNFLTEDIFYVNDNFKKKFMLIHEGFENLTTKRIDEFNVNAVIHLAALVSIPESMFIPEKYFMNNEYGTFNFLQVIYRTKNQPLIVYASSPEVYGNPKYFPMDINHPTDPRSIYAVTKLAAEKHCKAMYEWYGYPVVIIRNFNTFGPNQNLWAYAAVIPEFIVRAIKNEPLVIHNSGNQTRDFMYVKDASDAYVKVILKNKKLSGRTYNIGAGKQVNIRELADIIIKLADSKSEIIYEKGRPADLFALHADISNTIAEIDWKPRYSLEQGLLETITWYRKHLK